MKEPASELLPAVLTAHTPGWKTSEFWMTAFGHVGLVALAVAGVLPPKYAALAGALSQVAYTISRGLVKGARSN